MSVPGRKYKYGCYVCTLNLSYAADKNDITKQLGTLTHEAKANTSKNKFDFFVTLQ